MSADESTTSTVSLLFQKRAERSTRPEDEPAVEMPESDCCDFAVVVEPDLDWPQPPASLMIPRAYQLFCALWSTESDVSAAGR